MLKTSFSVRTSCNAILEQSSSNMKKCFFSNEMNSFFAMQKTDFHSLSLFFRKVILELKCTNHFFRASKNTNSVF